jgi:arylsulfatase A-like enzyme
VRGLGRWLGVAALVSGCAPPAAGPEMVVRLALAGAPAPTAVTAGGETRPATALRSPYAGRVCLPGEAHPAAGALEVGLRAAARGVTARLETPAGAAAEAPLGEGWTELRVDAPGGRDRCARLALRGAPGTAVAVSTPLWLRPGTRRPWVVLYVVDTFRFDDGPGGADPGVRGPAFAALAADGIRYRRAFSVTSWTRPAVSTLLTGVAPAVHGVFDRQDRLPASVPRLPARLAEAGWTTVAFSTNPNVLPLWGFLDGFDRFVDIDTQSWVAERGFAGLRDAMRRLVEERGDRPVFVYVHDNEPHLPYRPLPRYRALFDAPPEGSAAEIPRADEAASWPASRALHRAAVRATSDRFGELVDALRSAGRYADALIVLVGDHGEEFGEHGGVSHGRTLYQEQLHVPLVIKPPSGAAPAGSVDAPVSLEDVAPSVLALLELPAAPALAGRRLPLPGEAAAAPRAVVGALDLDGRRAEAAILWPWKYLRDASGERVFDLGADPGETTDRAAARPEIVAPLRALVKARRASAREGLWLVCFASGSETVVRAELRVPGASTPAVEGVGLEDGDGVTVRPGRIEAEFRLRPAESHPELARLDPIVAASTQPDRDGVRIAEVAGATVSVRLTASGAATPALAGPDGAPLPADGAPIPLAAIATSSAPRERGAPATLRCALHSVEVASETMPEEAVDPALRQRLRALGYLE